MLLHNLETSALRVREARLPQSQGKESLAAHIFVPKFFWSINPPSPDFGSPLHIVCFLCPHPQGKRSRGGVWPAWIRLVWVREEISRDAQSVMDIGHRHMCAWAAVRVHVYTLPTVHGLGCSVGFYAGRGSPLLFQDLIKRLESLAFTSWDKWINDAPVQYIPRTPIMMTRTMVSSTSLCHSHPFHCQGMAWPPLMWTSSTFYFPPANICAFLLCPSISEHGVSAFSAKPIFPMLLIPSEVSFRLCCIFFIPSSIFASSYPVTSIPFHISLLSTTKVPSTTLASLSASFWQKNSLRSFSFLHLLHSGLLLYRSLQCSFTRVLHSLHVAWFAG